MIFFKNLRKKIFSKESVSSLLIIIIIFFLDRTSKIIIIKQQIDSDRSLLINDYLNFDLIWNTGISFGLFSQNANIYYHIISLLIFLVIIFLTYLIIKANYVDKVFFSLILGGALGNFYDRLIYFAVPDFIDVHINNFHWFTFNVADIFISIGVIFLIMKDIILNKK
jgi:signal peptidase II|tara:strand:- start:317 stop:817 length:501 start_codon:yes stop_codon:yes gene_type:complete